MFPKFLTVILLLEGALTPTLLNIIGADAPLKSKQGASELQICSVLMHLKIAL